jgi:hypothetical protein
VNVKISGGVGYVVAYLTELASAQGLDKRFDTFLNGQSIAVQERQYLFLVIHLALISFNPYN